MKKLALLVLSAVLFLSYTANAQAKSKFAHVISTDILDAMPKMTDAEKAVGTFTTELESSLMEMQKELETKVNDYKANVSKYNETIKKTKEDEITALQQRIQDFSVNAQQEITKKRNELTQPIIEEVRKAIQDVGKENKYIYVFDLTAGSILFHSEESEDITPLVKKKLNIPATPAPAPAKK